MTGPASMSAPFGIIDAMLFSTASRVSASSRAPRFGIRDRAINDIFAVMQGRAGTLPGDTKPARADAGFEIVPPQKLN